MRAVSFDTLKFVEKLKTAGVPETQAKAIMEAQRDVFAEMSSNSLAHKSDIYDLKQEISELKVEIQKDFADLKTELMKMSSELRGHVSSETGILRKENANNDGDIRLLKWMFGFTFAGVASLVAKTFFFIPK